MEIVINTESASTLAQRRRYIFYSHFQALLERYMSLEDELHLHSGECHANWLPC